MDARDKLIKDLQKLVARQSEQIARLTARVAELELALAKSPSRRLQKSRGDAVSQNVVASRGISSICGQTCHRNVSKKLSTMKLLTKTFSG